MEDHPVTGERAFEVGRFTLSKLVARYGTPLYIYDVSIIRDRYRTLRDHLPSSFAIFYSLKANPNLAICAELRQLGAGAEVTSGGEMVLARAAGFRPEDIVFTGPGKSKQDLKQAIREGIYSIHVESLCELQVLERLSRRLQHRTRISLRVNPGGSVEGAATTMGGGPSQFGIDEEAVGEAVSFIAHSTFLDLIGLHFYLGTQILDAESLIHNIENIVGVADKICHTYRLTLQCLDIGPGIGIPYFDGQRPLDTGRLGVFLEELAFRIQRSTWWTGKRLILELGRYLVGESGLFVARIVSKKVSRGRTYLILDSGTNHWADTCSLRQTGRNFPVFVLGRGGDEYQFVDIVGPLCTPHDVIAQGVELPGLTPGDFIVIPNSGAYTFAGSRPFFSSHPTPAEVLVDGDRAYLVRRRGRTRDLLRGQSCARKIT